MKDNHVKEKLNLQEQVHSKLTEGDRVPNERKTDALVAKPLAFPLPPGTASKNTFGLYIRS
jgi:hypothetical protein